MPEGAIAVTRPGFYGNPFPVGAYCRMGDPRGRRDWMGMSWSHSLIGPQPGFTLIETREEAVEWYRRWVAIWSDGMLARARSALGGHDLACWCPLDAPCHADVLLELANA